MALSLTGGQRRRLCAVGDADAGHTSAGHDQVNDPGPSGGSSTDLVSWGFIQAGSVVASPRRRSFSPRSAGYASTEICHAHHLDDHHRVHRRCDRERYGSGVLPAIAAPVGSRNTKGTAYGAIPQIAPQSVCRNCPKMLTVAHDQGTVRSPAETVRLVQYGVEHRSEGRRARN